MIIGILADTHSLNIPVQVMERLKTVDLIIHAGDICDGHTLKLLRKLGPAFKAVQGNMDDPVLKKHLPVKEILDCERIKVGVTHGHVGGGLQALANAQSFFQGDHVDVVIFGHSHQAMKEKIGNTLFFNPGSPNDTVRAKFFSYGMIEIKAGKIKAEVIKF